MLNRSGIAKVRVMEKKKYRKRNLTHTKLSTCLSQCCNYDNQNLQIGIFLSDLASQNYPTVTQPEMQPMPKSVFMHPSIQVTHTNEIYK